MSFANAKFTIGAASYEAIPQDNRPHVAFVGRSNVGKSSLINALTAQAKLARTSSEPGRTRQINLFATEKGYLADLPGYGYAKLSKKERDDLQELIYDYLLKLPTLHMVAIVIDARIGPTDLDREMEAFVQTAAIPHCIIANKIDKLSRTEVAGLTQNLRAQMPYAAIFFHSSITGAGRGELAAYLEQALMVRPQLVSAPPARPVTDFRSPPLHRADEPTALLKDRRPNSRHDAKRSAGRQERAPRQTRSTARPGSPRHTSSRFGQGR